MLFSQTTRRAFRNLYVKISYFVINRRYTVYSYAWISILLALRNVSDLYRRTNEAREHYFTLLIFLPTLCKTDLRMKTESLVTWCHMTHRATSAVSRNVWHFCIPLQWLVICSEVWKLIVICSGLLFWIIRIIYRFPTTRCVWRCFILNCIPVLVVHLSLLRSLK